MEKRTDSANLSAFQVCICRVSKFESARLWFSSLGAVSRWLVYNAAPNSSFAYICQLVAFGSVAGRHSSDVIASLSQFMLHCINGENARYTHTPPPHVLYCRLRVAITITTNRHRCAIYCATLQANWSILRGWVTIKINETVIRAPWITKLSMAVAMPMPMPASAHLLTFICMMISIFHKNIVMSPNRWQDTYGLGQNETWLKGGSKWAHGCRIFIFIFAIAPDKNNGLRWNAR